MNPMLVSIYRGRKATDDSQLKGDDIASSSGVESRPLPGVAGRGLYVASADREALASGFPSRTMHCHDTIHFGLSESLDAT